MSFLSRSTLLATAFGTLGAAFVSSSALACGDDAYTGQVCVIAGSYCPKNTAEAAGQIIPIAGYEALFSLIGCTYGGNCTQSMGLPDLRGRAVSGYGTGPGLTGHAFAQYYGQEKVVQTVAQMAPHAHSAGFTPTGSSGSEAEVLVRQSNATSNVPQSGSMLGQPTYGLDPVNLYLDPSVTPGAPVELGGVSGGGGATGGTVTVGETGQGQALPTVPPRLAMRYCIVLNGIYPPRPN